MGSINDNTSPKAEVRFHNEVIIGGGPEDINSLISNSVFKVNEMVGSLLTNGLHEQDGVFGSLAKSRSPSIEKKNGRF